jgi:hypothetical protein
MNYFFEKKEKALLLLLEILIKDYFREKDSSPKVETNLRIDLEHMLKALEDLRSESHSFDAARNTALIL